MPIKDWQKRLVVVAFGSAFFYFATNPSQVASSLADGIYSNSCCGEIRLEDGTISTADLKSIYTLEENKSGLQVVPEHLIFINDAGRVTIDPKSHPMYIHVVKDGQRSYIEVPTDPSATNFSLVRFDRDTNYGR